MFRQDANPIYLFQYFQIDVDLSLHVPFPIFVKYNLTDGLHPFALILITAGIITHRKSGYFLISLCWLVINFLFELGQLYKSIAVELVPDFFCHLPFFENTINFFISGSFDPMDLIFISMGSFLGFIVLCATSSNSRRTYEKSFKKKEKVIEKDVCIGS